MKLKKWLLGLITFAAMVVICVVCAGAEKEHTAYIMYGDYNWFPSIMDYSGYYEDAAGVVTTWNSETCDVSKSGTYTVSISDIKGTYTDEETGDECMETVAGEGAVIFCVDINDLGADFGFGNGSEGFDEISTNKGRMDFAKEKGADVTDVKITQVKDGKATTVPVDISKVHFGDLEGNGKFRIEIYNDFGDTRYDPPIDTDKIDFNESLSVQFTIVLPKEIQKSTFEYAILPDETIEIIGYNGSESDVVIPDKIDGMSVTAISYGAFSDCIDIKSIAIPDSVTSISDAVFYECASLTKIDVAKDNASYSSVNGILFNKDKTELICFPIGKTDKSYIIPDSVIKICDYAFYGCTSLTTVSIPKAVTLIGYDAFYNCSSLTTVTIPDTVRSIESAAFACTAITEIAIPGNVEKVGDEAFVGCNSLASVTIKNGVKTLGMHVFTDTAIKEIVIPDSVTHIGEYAFFGCTSLVTIDVNASNKNYTSVNGILFNKDKTEIICYPPNKKDKSYNIPVGVTSISNGTFRDCSNLISIIMPYSVKKIGYSAFNGCTSLKTITMPNSVTDIGSYAFQGCTSLNNVTIPNSVTEIGWSAFNGCTSLTSITIPGSVTEIGPLALGYYYVGNNEYKKLDGFKIYCYSGTAGEKYAKDNGFAYELITAEKPANVTGFKVKSLTSTNVTLQWNKNTNASGYEIEQYKSGKWVNVAKITGNATTSYTVKGLAAGTAGYKFRMRAVRDCAYSDYTSEVTVNTNPYGVGGFKCSSKTSTSVTLKWNKGTTASGYQLQQYKDGKWVTIYTGTKATNTSYTVKKLKAGTAGYRFRIRAYKTYGNTKQYGSWSSEVKVNTNPYGVGGFKCSSKSSTSVTLKWNKGTTASGYQLQQYKDGKWVTIYTGTKATNTSYTVKNLKAGTAGYRFRIRAYKTYGNTKQYGSWSSEVKVNTNPYGVGGFKSKSTAKTSITLGWNKGTTASGYQLQQYKGGKWVTVYTGTKAASTSCTVKSLKANTSYKFRIRAYKTYGNTKQYGSWSKELTVKTKK